MLSKPRRCPDCDYTWSRYLDFLSCPKCGTNVPEARVGRELSRTRRLGLIGIVLFVIITVVSTILQIFFS
jgi:hypothetical protein